MNTQTSHRRLLKLASFLDKLPRKRFDYTRWVGDDWDDKQDLSCGTTACALGWAAAMPEFRRLGLCLTGRGTPEGTYVGLRGQDCMFTPLRAATAVFGIFEIDAEWLFQPQEEEDFATPKYVARKIRKFVADSGRPL